MIGSMYFCALQIMMHIFFDDIMDIIHKLSLLKEHKNSEEENEMKKIATKLLTLVLILSMVATFAGCGQDTPQNSATPSATSSATPNEPADTGSEGQSGDLHEIYTYGDVLSLSGIKPPTFNSRAHIFKALPEETTDKKLKIGLSIVSQNTAWFVEVGDSIKRFCDAKGWDLTMLIAEFSPEKQSEHVDTFITMGVDVILIDPTDVAAAKEMVQRAVDAGIPCIGIGQELAEDSAIVTSVMSNSYMNAFNVGLVAGDYFEGQPIKAGAMFGKLGSGSSESRINGFMGAILYKRAQQAGDNISKEDAMILGQKMLEQIRATGKAINEKYDFEVLCSNGDAEWSEIGGMEAAEEMITGYPDVNLLLVDQDFMAVGALQAVEQMGYEPGKDIQIISAADSYYIALEYIQEGKILATGYGPAAAIGEGVINLVDKIFVQGYDANDMVISTDLDPIAIYSENVDDFYDYPNTQFAKAIVPTYLTIPEYNAAHGN